MSDTAASDQYQSRNPRTVVSGKHIIRFRFDSAGVMIFHSPTSSTNR